MGNCTSRRKQRKEDRRNMKIISKIGEGSQGDVYKVVYQDKTVCAKFYDQESAMKQELFMLKAARKSGVSPKFIDSFTYQDQHNVVVMELCDGENLEDLVESCRLSEDSIHKITYELGAALMALHSTGVIHNDLKMDNIIIGKESGEIKVRIIDFGLSRIEGESPYPDLPLERVIEFPHLDPSLANGGVCTKNTDFYSYGKILLAIYERYRCPVYRTMGEMLCFNQTGPIHLEELLRCSGQE